MFYRLFICNYATRYKFLLILTVVVNLKGGPTAGRRQVVNPWHQMSNVVSTISCKAWNSPAEYPSWVARCDIYIYIYIYIYYMCVCVFVCMYVTQSFWTGTKVIRRKHIIQPTSVGACFSTCCQWDEEDVPCHGSDQTPTILFESKNHVSINPCSITYAEEEFLLSIIPNSVIMWSLQ